MISTFTSYLFTLLLSTGFNWISRYFFSLLKLADYFIEKAHHLLSTILNRRASGVFERKKSAVVLIGGKADLQTQTALQLSELGYTVFVVCSEHAEPTAQPASPIANLVYQWHKRKTMSWGMIAPIMVDTRLSTDRHRVVETVHAFCSKGSLRLSALVFLPSHDPQGTEAYPKGAGTSNLFVSKTVMDSTKARVGLWADAAAYELREILLFAQDFFEMLMHARGRVVFLKLSIGSSDSAHEGSARLAHDYLKGQLQPLGIRTITLAVDAMQNHEDCRLPGFSWAQLKQPLHTIYPDGEVGHALHRILQARYPMSRYAIGVYSLLLETKDNIKDLTYLCINTFSQTQTDS